MLSLIAMGIGSAIGGIFGAISTGQKKRRDAEQIARQKRQAEQAYEYKSAYDQGMFNLQKYEALETLGIARNRLGEAFGADVAGFNLELEGQAFQNQDARISLGDSAGMALAAQGASGTRGSDSLQTRLDYAENSFNRQADLQDRGNSLAMQNMARQYSNRFADIGREIDSWGPGGYKYEANELSKAYAAQMHGLEIQGYKDARADIYDPRYMWSDYMTGVFGGAGSGARFGNTVGGLVAQIDWGAAAMPALSNPLPLGDLKGFPSLFYK